MPVKLNKTTAQIFSCVFICLLIFFVADISMLHPVVKINYRAKKIVHSVLPEGWAFFTRDPGKEMEDIYKLQDDHFVRLNFSIAAPENLLGFSRKSTRINKEASFIAAQVPDSLWKLTYDKNDFDTISNAYTINDTKELALIKEGSYVIVFYRPVPWAYSNQPEDYKMQFKYAHIIIK